MKPQLKKPSLEKGQQHFIPKIIEKNSHEETRGAHEWVPDVRYNAIIIQFGTQIGVPQGSVLGARLFTMYTYHIALVFNKHKVEYHNYADNSQVYFHCDNKVTVPRYAVHQLENCIFAICEWMRHNACELNKSKTFLVRKII